jgi:protein Tex
MTETSQIIAKELNVNLKQVQSAVELLDSGATVPFVARYRKEATGGLDDTQLRHLEERLNYLRELQDRRLSVLKSIKEQEKLTPELEKKINAAETKTMLEDLYLPFKQKRRTKAQIAREAGLEPLAEKLLKDHSIVPESEAKAYLNPEHKIETIEQALEGARDILMEQFAETPELREKIRDYVWQHGLFTSVLVKGKEEEGAKFQDYFEFSEAIKKVPSHRALAIFRGRKEGILRSKLVIEEAETGFNVCEQMIADFFKINTKAIWLADVVHRAWRIKFMTFLEIDLLSRLRSEAELEAIQVFAKNLKSLLLAAPAGRRTTLGLDPGFRTGVKVVVVNAVGTLVDIATIYPHAPQKKWQQSLAILQSLCIKHKVDLISIGNGTASRETDQLADELIKSKPELKMTKLVVSEAGASVYSASALAAKEFPKLDVSLRGAVSIARRLQDPLAELVKIEPKAIGVGQYQHDVSQVKLSKSLEAVIEDCVNAVGVDVNSASAALLTRVSGLNATIANNVVDYRDQHGAFRLRETLKEVPRMGDKTFEQAAGFLRINEGDNPLDASSVHPETYALVNKIIQKMKIDIKTLVGNESVLKKINPKDFADDQFGLVTIMDILKELEKPGRDPRPEFKTATFKEGVNEIKDLKIGMSLEGVVTNVTNFGAFVDIGVHQDGLVHVSKLANHFVSNVHDIVKPGDLLKVKVEDVDIKRRRIALVREGCEEKAPKKKAKPSKPLKEPAFASAMSDAFKKRSR